MRAANGTGVNLALTSVVVTYVLPGVVGTDPAGFFVQSVQSGPAVLIAVDPATLGLTPALAAGDTISFTAADVGVESGTGGTQKRVTAVTGVTRVSQGFAVSSLVQTASAVDLVAQVADYESELVTVSGTITSGFVNAGAGFRSYQVTTTGVTTATSAFRLRMTETVAAGLATQPTVGCQFTVTATPLWRHIADAQVSVWNASELNLTGCPAASAARVMINEFNSNLGSGCDQIELRVSTAGPIGGFTLQTGWGSSGPMVTFPTMTVAKNDFIVIHTGTAANCAGGTRPANETTSVNQVPQSTQTANYDTAYDFWTDAGGLTNTTNVVAIVDNAGGIQDAVAWWDGNASSVSGTTTGLLTFVNAGSTAQWADTGGAAVTGAPVATYTGAAVTGALGTTTAGGSAQRTSNTDTNKKADWGVVSTPTWGVLNAGQTAF